MFGWVLGGVSLIYGVPYIKSKLNDGGLEASFDKVTSDRSASAEGKETSFSQYVYDPIITNSSLVQMEPENLKAYRNPYDVAAKFDRLSDEIAEKNRTTLSYIKQWNIALRDTDKRIRTDIDLSISKCDAIGAREVLLWSYETYKMDWAAERKKDVISKLIAPSEPIESAAYSFWRLDAFDKLRGNEPPLISSNPLIDRADDALEIRRLQMSNSPDDQSKAKKMAEELEKSDAKNDLIAKIREKIEESYDIDARSITDSGFSETDRLDVLNTLRNYVVVAFKNKCSKINFP
jgi:hypothetical protein